MKKSDIVVEVFQKSYDGILYFIDVDDIPEQFLERGKGFKIDIDRTEEDYTVLTIHQRRKETDEEFEKRKKFWIKKEERNKQNRYEEYLKLKKEFENDKGTINEETGRIDV